MSAVADLIIAVFDLAEAQLRAVKEGAFRMATGLSMVVLALALALAGLALALLALYGGLSEVLHHAWAALVTGGVSFLAAGVALAIAHQLTRK